MCALHHLTNCVLTANQVTFGEEHILLYDTAGYNTILLWAMDLDHATLGGMTVQSGYMYTYVKNKKTAVVLVFGVDAYMGCRKYAFFALIRI